MNLEQSFFSAIYRNAPIGLVILDRSAAVVDANDYMFRLFQVEKDHYQGQQFGNRAIGYRCSGENRCFATAQGPGGLFRENKGAVFGLGLLLGFLLAVDDDYLGRLQILEPSE